MMEKINITFNKFTCRSSITPLFLYKELIKSPYKSDCGWGFSEVSLLGESISAILFKEVSASYRVWNADTNSMEKISYNRIKEIPLLIDFTNNFLIVEGGVTCLNINNKSSELSIGILSYIPLLILHHVITLRLFMMINILMVLQN